MSLKILKPRERKTRTTYSLEFLWKDDPGAGFSFSCDRSGNVDETKLPKEALRNYKMCMSDNGDKLYGPRVRKDEYRYTEDAFAKCDCGEKFYLQDQYQGACQCPGCGRWYNLSGQSLVDPKYWESDDDYEGDYDDYETYDPYYEPEYLD